MGSVKKVRTVKPGNSDGGYVDSGIYQWHPGDVLQTIAGIARPEWRDIRPVYAGFVGDVRAAVYLVTTAPDRFRIVNNRYRVGNRSGAVIRLQIFKVK